MQVEPTQIAVNLLFVANRGGLWQQHAEYRDFNTDLSDHFCCNKTQFVSLWGMQIPCCGFRAIVGLHSCLGIREQ